MFLSNSSYILRMNMKPASENLPAAWLLSYVITNTEYHSCYLTEYRDHDSKSIFHTQTYEKTQYPLSTYHAAELDLRNIID